MIIKRGEIYMVYFGEITEESGSEQRGPRPALILQNDIGNRFSSTTIVAPITLHGRKFFPTHVDLSGTGGLAFGNKVLLEQIRSIDKRHIFGELIGVLDEDDMKPIEHAIKISLGLTCMGGGEYNDECSS